MWCFSTCRLTFEYVISRWLYCWEGKFNANYRVRTVFRDMEIHWTFEIILLMLHAYSTVRYLLYNRENFFENVHKLFKFWHTYVRRNFWCNLLSILLSISVLTCILSWLWIQILKIVESERIILSCMSICFHGNIEIYHWRGNTLKKDVILSSHYFFCSCIII